MSKRKSDEIEEDPRILRTCSDCNLFCAKWSKSMLTTGGVKYHGGLHAHRIWDNYHQHYLSESESESEDDEEDGRRGGEEGEPTLIGAGGDGCTAEQRLALLCSLRKIAEQDNEKKLLVDPKFLKSNFEELLCDDDTEPLSFVLLYGCNKDEVECFALARGRGVADIEKEFGKLQPFEVDEENEFYAPPGFIEDFAATDEHFVLTTQQWERLRINSMSGGNCCRNYMSILTFRDGKVWDVAEILQQSLQF